MRDIRSSSDVTIYRNSLIINFLLTFGIIEALAEWRQGQRSQTLPPLNLTEALTFADQTDIGAIRQLLKPILCERIVDTPKHRKVGQYLEKTLKTYGFTTEWDIFTEKTPLGLKTFRNLIGTSDQKSRRWLVVACHYDSKYMPGEVFIAATDSALPCALMLDLARTLSPAMNKRTNQDIALKLVFLDGEEAFVRWTDKDSVYGARHLADKWMNSWYPTNDLSTVEFYKEIDRVDVFVLLDLLGASQPFPQIFAMREHGTKELFQYLPEIETLLGKHKKLRNINPIFRREVLDGVYIEDDHVPFMKKGVPIMHLIPPRFPDVWHKVSDDESALDDNVIYNLATVMRVFVACYLDAHPVYINQDL